MNFFYAEYYMTYREEGLFLCEIRAEFVKNKHNDNKEKEERCQVNNLSGLSILCVKFRTTVIHLATQGAQKA